MPSRREGQVPSPLLLPQAGTAAAIAIASEVLVNPGQDIGRVFMDPVGVLCFTCAVIFVLAVVLNIRFKANPILLTVLAPMADLLLLWQLLGQWIAYTQHGTEFNSSSLWIIGIYYLVFVVVDLVGSIPGCRSPATTPEQSWYPKVLWRKPEPCWTNCPTRLTLGKKWKPVQ